MNLLIDHEKKIAEWHTRVNEVASNHTQVTGVLAGFSITVAVLVASIKLTGDASSIYIQAGFGLFLAGFFGYVSAGIMYSMPFERENNYQYFLFTIASLLFYLSVALSFAALVLLTEILGYSQVRPGAITAMSCAIIGGFAATAIPIYDLLRIKASALIIILNFIPFRACVSCNNAVLASNISKTNALTRPSGDNTCYWHSRCYLVLNILQ